MNFLKTSLFFTLFLSLVTIGHSQVFTDCISSTISTESGNNIAVCLGDGDSDRIRFNTSPLATPFAFMAVDENDIIVSIGLSNFIEFEDLPEGNYRIFSVSFIGEVTGQVGDNYLNTQLGSYCFQISPNFITVSNATPVGGMVSTATGETAITLCADPGIVNIVDFATTSTSAPYVFVLTDGNNIILDSSANGVFDFTGAPAGLCKVWGVAYQGDFLGVPGDDLLTANLASVCFDLSDNAVDVVRLSPDPGSLSYADGSTAFTSCSVLPPTGSVSLASSFNQPNVSFAYVMVDANTNAIVQIFTSATLNLADQPVGSFLIYSVAYTGNQTAAVGDTYDGDNFSDECSTGSADVLSFIKRVQNADDVNLADGSSETTICVGDGIPDELTFTSTYLGDDNFIYLITDESNFLLGTNTTGTIDFEGAEAGICRVWGLAYSGNLTVTLGESIAGVLSDECFDLSDGFVLINRNGPAAGSISFADGSDSFVSCTPLPPSGSVAVTVTGNSPNVPFSYVFVNNETGIITEITENATLDLATLANGNYNIYGVSYVGELGAAVGDAFDETSVGGSCFAVSAPINLIRRVQNADDVMLSSGADSITVCVGDGSADELTITSTYAGDDSFIYVVTNAGNFVLETSTSGIIDFENAPAGLCRVWGLAYSGNLTINPGDNLGGGQPLSDECFDLSDGYVAVNRITPQGGTINFVGGADAFLSCTSSDIGNTLQAAVTGNNSALDYVFVLTNSADESIVALSTTGNINANELPNGTYSVFGLAYQAPLSLNVGDVFDVAAASAACFGLSGNSLSIVRAVQDAGTVSVADGMTNIAVCAGDGVDDTFTFTTTYAGDESFLYVITDENNIILDTSADGVINFEGAGAGICRVWGLAYSGTLTAGPGDDAAAVTLSDECFDLSDNFVTVVRTAVAGGSLSFDDGTDSLVSCTPLPPSGTVTITANGANTDASYTLLFVDNSTGIITTILENEFAFDLGTYPNGNFDIYGISHTAPLALGLGDTFAADQLGGDCADLADNTLNLIRRVQNADDVMLADGRDSIVLCVGDGVADELTFSSTYTGEDNFVYLITDQFNFLLDTSAANVIDFEGAGAGICRVWGLAYTGELTIEPGQSIGGNTAFSTECSDLSDGFVYINRNGPVGGTIAYSSGAATYSSCTPLNVPGVPTLSVSGNEAGADYTFIAVNDATGTIAMIFPTGSFNEPGLANGTYTIYGLSYLGDLPYAIGDSFDPAALEDCVDTASNTLALIREVEHADDVLLEDGSNEITLCVGDGIADELTFTNTYTGDDNFVYVITNGGNFILDFNTSGTIDFEGAGGGICRVWGLAYSGELLLAVGDNLGAGGLFSDECFDLSDGFVTINRNGPDAGVLTFSDGSTSFEDCEAADGTSILTIVTTGAAEGIAYVYAVVDTETGLVTRLTNEPEIDLADLPLGTYQVFGISYLDNLVLSEGDEFINSDIADVCFAVSAPLEIVNRSVNISPISFEDGSTVTTICPNDDLPDVLNFSADFTGDGDLAYLVTTVDNEILAILASGSTDFGDYTGDFVRIWAVAYTGNFLLQSGQIVDADLLISDECSDLTNSFLTVDLRGPRGGELSLEDGSTSTDVCTNDGI
ncbi:MAG: hypothetical protein AAGJ82_07540, partial [Bacteroidota bacterium]